MKKSFLGLGHLASSAILGVGSTSSQLGIILFGLGSTDEKILRSIANYKLSVSNYNMLLFCKQIMNNSLIEIYFCIPIIHYIM